MVDGWVPKGDAEAGRAPNTYQPPPQQMAGPPSYHTYEAPMQGVQFSQSPLPPSGAPPPPSYHTYGPGAAAPALPAYTTQDPAASRWVKKWDPSTGRAFWQNDATQATSWEDPYGASPTSVSATSVRPGASGGGAASPAQNLVSSQNLHAVGRQSSIITSLPGANFFTQQGNVQIEEGKTLKFDKKGNFYLEDVNPSDEDAANEHRRKNLGMMCSQQEITECFGKETTQYFNFLKFIMCSNLLLTLVAFIGFIPHVANAGGRLEDSGVSFLLGFPDAASLDLLFLSTVQPSTDSAWITMMVLGFLVIFLTGPAYLLVSTYYLKDYSDVQDGATAELDAIEDNVPFKSSRVPRLIGSYMLFGVCLALPLIVMYLVLYLVLQRYMQATWNAATKDVTKGSFDESLEIGIALLVSIIVPISNALFETVVAVLTGLEKHPTWTSFRDHRLAKLTLFRLSNIIGLFALRFNADQPWYTCMSGRMGYQVLIYLLIDITLSNLIELFAPWFIACGTRIFGTSAINELSDEENKPDFELSDEYFEIVYRQYVICMGFSVMPMIALIGLTANLIELPVDKYRLLHICRRPRGCMVGGRRTLVSYLLFAAIAGMVTFPTGLIWFAGPVLCWPCPQYTQEVTSSGGGCSPAFEHRADYCQDSTGASISPSDIRGHIAELKSSDATVKKSGMAWFDNNDQLWSHRRCNCRPCNLVISCGCNKPVLDFFCENLSPFVCSVSSTTPCASLVDASACPLGETCVDGLPWTARHCSTPRSDYSATASEAHSAVCVGGTNADSACTAQSDCADGRCDTYCPTPLSDKVPVVGKCWQCPEVAVSGLVNPEAAKKSWEQLEGTICSRCLGNAGSCICDSTCSI